MKLNKLIKCAVLLICVATVFSVFFIPGAVTQSEKNILMCKDDEWYASNGMAWYEIGEYHYVSARVFSSFDNISVAENRKLNTLMISSKDGKFVSFNTDTNMVTTDDGREISLNTYRFKNDTFVPSEFVCSHFSLLTEISPNGNFFRVYDSQSLITLQDLVRIYYPDYYKTEYKSEESTEKIEEVETENNQETESVPPNEQETDEIKIGACTVYLTFEGKINSYTSQIVNLLASYGVYGTFFIEGDNIEENAETVRDMVFYGHSVGLHTVSANEKGYSENFDLLISELNTQNVLLNKVSKIKSRIFRAPNGSVTSTLNIGKDGLLKLNENGYIMWDWNVDSKDYTKGIQVENIVDNVISGIGNNKVSVVRFQNSSNAVKALSELLKFFRDNPQIKVKKITNATSAYDFIY